ncbi:hypothetical protein ACEPAF_929 [Sanghuangporus sanghuang]
MGETKSDLVEAIHPIANVERERRRFACDYNELDGPKLSIMPTDGASSPAAEVTKEKVEDTNVPSRTPAMKRKERVQLFSLFFAMFVAGWDGGTYGPLLPRFQTYYHVNYTVVSMIFITNCVGFIVGAISNVYLTDRLGLGKALVLGSIAQVIGYSLMSPRLHFPVFCIAFFIDGWGLSIQDAQANGYVAGLTESSATKMGMMHALYGLGAMFSPFAATEFAKMSQHWSYHFVASVGLATINTLILLLVFRGRVQDECFREIGEASMKRGTSQQNKYRQILSQKVVHLLAIFSLVYVGIEITIAGWTVSYIQEYRGGGASAGYVSTGFFGGLTLGRVALLWINNKVGEHRVMYIYMLLSVGLELVVWLVPSVVSGGIAVSFVGFFLGPMYPILMNETGRLLPQWLLTGSIGWIASFGFSGSALFPFITGALAEEFGIKTLQPILVVLMVVMMGLWLLVPDGSRTRRQETEEHREATGTPEA